MKEPSKEALALAVQAWCTPETESIEMDSRLVIAFANVLDENNFTNQLNAKSEKQN